MRHIQATITLHCEVLVSNDASDDSIYESIVHDCYNTYGYKPMPEDIFEMSEIIDD